MATNLIYAAPGATTTFAPSGGNVLWTPTGIAIATGRISGLWDRGAGSKPVRYRWRCSTHWAATPALGDCLRLYLITSEDGTTASKTDGGLSIADGTITSENQLLYDCLLLGAVTTEAVDAIRSTSGIVNIYARYLAIAGWNASTTKALSTTAADHVMTFTEIPDDIEASA